MTDTEEGGPIKWYFFIVMWLIFSDSKIILQILILFYIFSNITFIKK